MKRILLIIIMAVCGLQSCDDESITPENKSGIIEGKVTDQYGLPLRDVSISTNPATITVLTDSLGKFKLSNVIAGTYSIIATKDGVQKTESASVVSSLTTTVNFTLTMMPANGLVAYYTFKGNALDASGNNYNGQVNGAILTEDRFGISGNAYKFDGNDDYIAVENVADSKLEPNAEISISCFIKADDRHGKNRWSRIIKKAAAFDNGYALSWDHELNGNLQMFLAYDNIPEQFYTPNDIVTTPNTNLVGEWHHVAMTYAKNEKIMRLYVDGKLVSSTENCSYSFQHSGDVLLIGGALPRELNGKTYYETFPGSIDDIRIYNRILNISEIDLLYHEGGFKN